MTKLYGTHLFILVQQRMKQLSVPVSARELADDLATLDKPLQENLIRRVRRALKELVDLEELQTSTRKIGNVTIAIYEPKTEICLEECSRE